MQVALRLLLLVLCLLGSAAALSAAPPPPPASPCNSICRYKRDFYDGQVCIGCHRDIFEIKSWISFSDAEKQIALLDAADRKAEWERHLAVNE